MEATEDNSKEIPYPLLRTVQYVEGMKSVLFILNTEQIEQQIQNWNYNLK